MKPCLTVHMFGGLTVTYNGEPVQLSKELHGIVVQFLLMLWESGKRGISRSMILYRLYGEHEVTDPANSMRVNLYRLKNLVREMPLPQGEYVIKKGADYYWNDSEVQLKTDVEEFEELICLARECREEEKRKNALKKACALYKGEFLPPLAAERWAAMRSVDYERMYTDAVQMLYEIHMAEGEYEAAALTASAALNIYTYEIFAAMEIDARMRQGDFKRSLEVLEIFSKNLFKEFGVMPSDMITKRYNAVMGRMDMPRLSIKEFERDAAEKCMDGAYYCPFPSFINCYHILRRMAERSELPILLVSCFMADAQGQPFMDADETEKLVPILLKTFEDTLRKGDTYTRSNHNLFFLLLAGIREEDFQNVSMRLTEKFKHERGKTASDLKFFVIHP